MSSHPTFWSAGVPEEVATVYGMRLDCGPGEALYEDVVAIFKTLHIVDNNSPRSVGGGGVPRQPRAAPICGI